MTGIYIKNESEIALMRKACKLAADTLVEVGKIIREGITTAYIDRFVYDFVTSHNAIPAPLNYKGFPASVCISLNEMVCHGIPSDKIILTQGDIVNVDITVILDGWHGDTSATFYIGKPSKEIRSLVEVARQCLEIGISKVRPGARIHEIGDAIEKFARKYGYGVVRDYVGHGIGREFHEKPQIPHFANSGANTRMIPGMTFTIEPMINMGTWQVRLLPDGWTAVTADGKPSAQFEHTVLVCENGVEILTKRDQILHNSEDV